MSKTMILAPSGFGKSSMIAKTENLGIEGLSPTDTFVITVTNKEVPGDNGFMFEAATKDEIMAGTKKRRFVSNNAYDIADVIDVISPMATPIMNIILDDSNYIMQDYYMLNALKAGWDAPKKMGHMMGAIFAAIDRIPEKKNFFMFAHPESFKDSNGTLSFQMKTTGNMVREYSTPEGKFENLWFGKQTFDDKTRKIRKVLVTQFDGDYPAKTFVHGLFELEIPNDLGPIVRTFNNEVERKAKILAEYYASQK